MIDLPGNCLEKISRLPHKIRFDFEPKCQPSLIAGSSDLPKLVADLIDMLKGIGALRKIEG